MKDLTPQIAFMLSQLGAHTAAEFRKLIQNLGITMGHSGIMRLVSLSQSLSQKDLADRLSLLPSRLVVLIDELEGKGLIERQSDPNDRRSHMLRLTDRGRQMVKSLNALSKKLGDRLCAPFDDSELPVLSGMLTRIAEDQGLAPNVHPGYKDRE